MRYGLTEEEIATATRELLAAGWTLQCDHHDIWLAPDGKPHLGPAKALEAMRAGGGRG